jgi:hypothetical protein
MKKIQITKALQVEKGFCYADIHMTRRGLRFTIIGKLPVR